MVVRDLSVASGSDMLLDCFVFRRETKVQVSQVPVDFRSELAAPAKGRDPTQHGRPSQVALQTCSMECAQSISRAGLARHAKHAIDCRSIKTKIEAHEPLTPGLKRSTLRLPLRVHPLSMDGRRIDRSRS